MMSSFVRLQSVGIAGLMVIVGCASGPEEGEVAENGDAVDYRIPRYFDALGTLTTIHKTPRGAWVEIPGRDPIALSEVQALEAAHRRAIWGPFDPSVYNRLSILAPDDATRATFVLRVPHGAPPMRGADQEAGRLQHREQLRSLIEGIVAEIEPQLQAAGLEIVYASPFVPVMVVEGARDAVFAVASDPRIVRVLEGRPSDGYELANADPVAFHEIDKVFNDNGFFAEKERVGIIEYGQYEGGACGLYDKHEALEFNTVTYQTPPALKCSKDADCFSVCDTCIDSVCVTDHGSQVASVVAQSESGVPRGSASAGIWFPNAQPSCDPAGILTAYDWLLSNDVYTTNESFGCNDPVEEGGVQDYYARIHGVTVVRAAGNSAPEGRACPYLVNSICVGATSPASDMACYSSALNPWRSDREEPDVTALGGQATSGCLGCDPSNSVEVMDFSSATAWTSNCGTSFAAPTVASLALLVREECRDSWGFMPPTFLRAIFRTAAWGVNPDGLQRYSTPSLSDDWKDGGGMLSAAQVSAFCHPGGDVKTGGGSGEIDLDGGEPMPGGRSSYDPGSPRKEGYEDFRDYTPAPGARRYTSPFSAKLVAGQRLRFTVAWNSCSIDPGDAAPTATAVDVDLFLYNRSTGIYVFGSQSVDDVNEGFDVVIQQADGDGDYEVMIAWPEDAKGCDGSTVEPYAWAWALWGA